MVGTGRVEVESFITRETVEWAYRECKRAQVQRRESLAAQGWRAAKARDPKLLKALEGGAAILQKMSEEQIGTHGMDIGGIWVESTEYQLWREAYKAADEGQPLRNFEWIYFAAALLAGLIT